MEKLPFYLGYRLARSLFTQHLSDGKVAILSRIHVSKVAVHPADPASLRGSTSNLSLPFSFPTLWKEVTQPTLPEGAECVNDASSSK